MDLWDERAASDFRPSFYLQESMKGLFSSLSEKIEKRTKSYGTTVAAYIPAITRVAIIPVVLQSTKDNEQFNALSIL